MNVEDQLQYRDTHNQTEEKKADSSESNASDWGDNNDDSASKAGALRELRKNGNTNGLDSAENTGEPQDLRSAVQAKRSGLKKKASKAIEAAVSKVSAATSALLKSAWENLIDSWGLTLIWIDIHVFANQVFGDKMFCNLGEEWLQANAAKSFGKAAGDKLDAGKKAANLIESMGCGCLNFGCFLLVLVVICQIALIAGFFDNPFKAIAALLGTIWHKLSGG